jgi:hypothetical protein
VTDISTRANGARSNGVRTTLEGFERARKVADAVLYEGYVLYPYRASAAKNQVRWQFGVVAPREHCEAEGGERWRMQTEVLVEGSRPIVDMKLRFLRVQTRTVEDASGSPVAFLEVDGHRWTTWDEAVEEELDVEALGLGQRVVAFELEPVRMVEELGGAGRVVRERYPISGEIRVTAERLDGPCPFVKFRIEVANVTPWTTPGATRDDVVRRSLTAVHTLVAAHHGQFISLTDYPEFASGAVASCVNEGTWPVLIGDEGQRSVMLSSPITLPDYPEIAPESEGDMFDSTEIDEILALRVLTLTDEEKHEARGTDERAAAIIDRVDAMPPELFDRLHGAVRYLRTVTTTGASVDGAGVPVDSGGRGPYVASDSSGLRPKDPGARHEQAWWDPGVDASVNPWEDTALVGTHQVGRGAHVRLQPTGRADAHDMFLIGKTATVEGVFFDVDGETQFAVTLDDDPGTDMARAHGRYLYFRPDELEFVSPADPA